MKKNVGGATQRNAIYSVFVFCIMTACKRMFILNFFHGVYRLIVFSAFSSQHFFSSFCRMLDEMEDGLAKSTSNLNLITRKTKDLIKKSGGKKNFLLIVVLSAIVIVLLFLVICV